MAFRERAAAPGLVYAALSAGIVSALGILLVPSIARAYGIPVASAQWMLTVNLLAGVVATPVMGRLSDGPRKRRVLMWSIGIIGAGSLVCAVAPTFEVFQVGRVLQGVSYGVFPVAASVARRQLAGSARMRRTLSSLAISGALGTGLGYPITGILAQSDSFRLAYVFGMLFMASAMLVVRLVVDADPPAARGARLDIVGALLLGGGMLPLLLWIAEGPHWGWASPVAGVLLAASAVLCAGWAVHALRTPHPLVDVRTLGRPDVLLANAVAVAFGVTIYVVASGSGLVGQAPSSSGYGLGWGVALAGLIMVPMTLGTFLSNLVVGRLARESAAMWALPVGSLVEVAASVVLVLGHAVPVALFAGMALAGLGMGAVYGALPLLVARAVPAEDFGSAMSMNQVLRTCGGAIGSAASGAVIAASATATGFPDRAGIMLNFAIPGAVAAIAAVVLGAVVLRRR